MSTRLSTSLLGGFAALAAYGLVALLMTLLAGEAASLIFVASIVGSPLAIAAGIVLGRRLHPSRGRAIVLASGIGAFIPVVGLLVLWIVSGYEQMASRERFDNESSQKFEAAKKSGFPFPKGAKAWMPGAARTDQGMPEVTAFYDRQPDWIKESFGREAWFVKPAGSQRKLVQLKFEYRGTSIYFSDATLVGLQKEVARGFSEAAEREDWKLAMEFLAPDLQQKGDQWLVKTLEGIRPSSSPFERTSFNGNSSAAIAVNAKVEAGRMFKYAEIGYFFTEDVIPKIRKIELPERH
jgi:hypothetical protein